MSLALRVISIKYIVLLFLVSSTSWAEEVSFDYSEKLTLSHAVSACMGKSENGKYYKYAVDLVVKNNGDTDVTVISDTIKASRSYIKAEKRADVFITNRGKRSINDVPIIPSEASLGLVTLKSGDGAFIHTKFNSRHFLESLTIHYKPWDAYSGRFKYWTGITKGLVVKPELMGDCSS